MSNSVYPFRRLINVFWLGSKLLFLVVLLPIILIWYDVSRTESALNDLYNQLRNGVPLLLEQLKPPEHGIIYLSVTELTGERYCLSFSSQPDDLQIVWRIKGEQTSTEKTEPATRKDLFIKLADMLKSMPNCRKVHLILHQKYGFMSGLLKWEVRPGGTIVHTEPPTFVD